MFDRNGVPIKLGDYVKLWEGAYGYIVCDFDNGKFTEKYPKADWGDIKSGVLIQMESGELMQYGDSDEDIERIER